MSYDAPFAGLKVIDGGSKPLTVRAGSVLFAHFGLTGPAPLDVSRAVSGHPEPARLAVEVDFLPDTPEAEYEHYLQHETAAHGKKQLAVVMAERLPRRLCDQMLTLAGLPEARTCARVRDW